MANAAVSAPAGSAPTLSLKVRWIQFGRHKIQFSLTNRYQDNDNYVYFHSGSEATYRKVADNPSSFTSIPTIDLAELDSPSRDARKKIAKDIYDACSQCGFFYVENHGVPQHVITETLDLLKRFFALDLDAKMDAHVQKNPAIRGYEPMLETRLDPRTKGGE